MGRVTFEEIFMTLSANLSRRSTCNRLSVGAVVTSSDFRRILGIGYNGNARGLNNCCDKNEPGQCGCLHAEENAIINSAHHAQEEKIFFVTHIPCPSCAKRIINMGNVKKVYYLEDYRRPETLDLLPSQGIEVEKFFFNTKRV